ncbi:hypothetical protein [Streptomyces qinzhouensis]|uniref:DUF3558 domain-containing protein n=1 Tax=Streptomyces qinzhouensis TaxID=2599401 RepID=A0A5B8JNF1_9ACTN|nr:hypothetical protein [Streptomyces qinzhouensis]QDY79330.1 hypothetical protein FQU76_25530 [Streptomyces qinzhouensis]
MTQHPRAGTAPFRAARWTALTLTLALGVTGCTQGKTGNKLSGVSSAKICDSTLDSAAQAALKKATRIDRFEELPGDEFTLDAMPQGLHHGIQERTVCRVYTTDEGDDIALFTIDFEPRTHYPRETQESSKGERILYPVGKYAAADGDSSVQIFFPCPTTGEKGRTPFVRSSMSTPRPLAGESTADERMTVLNSISRRVAERLGCAAASGLPQQLPAPPPAGT